MRAVLEYKACGILFHTMKIVLATGIYPPDIGGPATYAYHLAKEFTDRQHQVTVVTYICRKSPAYAKATAGRLSFLTS